MATWRCSCCSDSDLDHPHHRCYDCCCYQPFCYSKHHIHCDCSDCILLRTSLVVCLRLAALLLWCCPRGLLLQALPPQGKGAAHIYTAAVGNTGQNDAKVTFTVAAAALPANAPCTISTNADMATGVAAAAQSATLATYTIGATIDDTNQPFCYNKHHIHCDCSGCVFLDIAGGQQAQCRDPQHCCAYISMLKCACKE